MKKHSLFALGIFLSLASSACAQTIAIGTALAPAGSITITPNPFIVPVGVSLQANVAIVRTDQSVDPSNYATQAVWSVDNASIATVGSTGLITGVAAGSANVTATLGSLSATLPITVSGPPNFVSPSPNCTQPCPLNSGVQNTAYTLSSVFAATGGITPYTFTLSAGSLPTGLSLSNSGCGSNVGCAITGTPTGTGTSTFTIQLADNSGGADPSKTMQMSITIAAGGSCGPSTGYKCSSTSTANPGTISAIFASTAPTASTCSGDCKGTTRYDTTINPSGIDGYTRMTDGTTNAGKSVSGSSCASGDNDLMGSVNEDYYSYIMNDGLMHVSKMQTTNPYSIVVDNGFTLKCPAAFSRVTDNVVYNLANGHTLNKCVINGSTNGCSSTTTLYELQNCPGMPAGLTSATVMGLGLNDAYISVMMGTQGPAYMVVIYRASDGACASLNFGDPAYVTNGGSYYDWCVSSCGSAAPKGTLATSGNACWGVKGTGSSGGHETYLFLDGSTIDINPSSTWTLGACAGQGGDTYWSVDTATTNWCTRNSPNFCGNHQSAGVTHVLTPSYNGMNIRTYSTPGTLTTFTPSSSFTTANGNSYNSVVSTHDQHLTWIHPNGDDSFPVWVGATDSVTTNSFWGSGCTTSNVYCPTYPQNLVVGSFIYQSNALPVLFGHTFSCGQNVSPYAICTNNGTSVAGQDQDFMDQNSIGWLSQQGNWFFLSSCMLNAEGNDSGGKPRCDLYRIGPLQ